MFAKLLYRDSLGSPEVRTLPSNAGAQVQSLVRELRSLKVRGIIKPKHKTETRLLFSQPVLSYPL